MTERELAMLNTVDATQSRERYRLSGSPALELSMGTWGSSMPREMPSAQA
jgi:hypothetical protein